MVVLERQMAALRRRRRQRVDEVMDETVDELMVEVDEGMNALLRGRQLASI